MKYFKKLLPILLLTYMLFSLTACEKTADERDAVRMDESVIPAETDTKEVVQAEAEPEKTETKQKSESDTKSLKEISKEDLTAEERDFFESFLNFIMRDRKIMSIHMQRWKISLPFVFSGQMLIIQKETSI